MYWFQTREGYCFQSPVLPFRYNSFFKTLSASCLSSLSPDPLCTSSTDFSSAAHLLLNSTWLLGLSSDRFPDKNVLSSFWPLFILPILQELGFLPPWDCLLAGFPSQTLRVCCPLLNPQAQCLFCQLPEFSVAAGPTLLLRVCFL